MPPRKRSVRAVKVYVPDADLLTTRVSGRGFQATFADGSHGPTRKTFREARADARAHNLAGL